MASNKISCSAGKTSLVDPNAFDGQNSSSNISVPLEDLNISVELSTEKKGRTILTSSKLGGNLTGTNVASETSSMKLNFIEGTDVGGTGVKSLTTKFTDLTTTFDSGGDGENLGITSIDIDFNTSYAPLITINMVDLRGSAIFQNEETLANETNKYATFFTLPYPMYNLTIKGYYGQPVTYCLHMTKFNAKFNSQTGNFEITCSFIGYTYAMLSDLLLGYLKAIPYTKLGSEKYKELKKEDPTLLTLVELLKQISLINTDAAKISADDPDAKQFASAEQKLSQLSDIENTMSFAGVEFSSDFKSKNSDYKFVAINAVSINKDPAVTTKNAKIITDYVKKVGDAIDIYNGDGNTITIDNKSDFTSAFSSSYTDLSLDILSPILPPVVDPSDIVGTKLRNDKIQSEKNLRIKFIKIKSDDEFNKKRREIYNYVKDNLEVSNTVLFDIYDLTALYAKIKEKNTAINKQKRDLQKSLAETLKASITKRLGFSPTARGIINVFTAAAEVFLSVIYNISQSAIKDENETRRAQLEPKFKISPESTDQFGAGPNGGKIPLAFYPWPDYREVDENDALTEKYLGDPFVLDIPSDVHELKFIDELLNAFLTAQAAIDDIAQELAETSTNWIPINPLDTRIFTDKFPYNRMEALLPEDVYRLMTIRAMIFLGVTNGQDSSGKSVLTNEEIQAVAKAEAASMILDTGNSNVLRAIVNNADKNKFITSTGKLIPSQTNNIQGGQTTSNVIKLDNDIYDYSYIWDTGHKRTYKILPINGPFDGIMPYTPDIAIESAKNGSLYLTNYTSSVLAATDNNGTSMKKTIDGGVYISLIDVATYSKNALPLPTTETPSSNVLDLEKLKSSPKDAGYNIMGSPYGIQEYRELEFGGELGKLPFMFMFYSDGNYDSYTYNKSNGLALKRSVSGKDGKPVTGTFYDNTFTGQATIGAISDTFFTQPLDAAIRLIDYDHTEGLDLGLYNDFRTHKDYGKNMKLLKSLKIDGSQDVTYPFINFQVWHDVDDSNIAGKDLDLAPVSLFGSRLYYEQINSPYPDYAKAFLFLHTFPWKGLVEDKDSVDRTIFDVKEIINTFTQRGGFIGVPKLWVAFIGGLLWRADFSKPVFDDSGVKIIDGGSDLADPILWKDTTDAFIPGFSLTSNLPNRWDYLTSIHDGDFPSCPMSFETRVLPGREYKAIDKVLMQLPDQVKYVFKKAFFDFVKSDSPSDLSDWDSIKTQFEIFQGTSAQWKLVYNSIVASAVPWNGTKRKVVYKNVMKAGLSVKNGDKYNIDNYIIISPLLGQSGFEYNYILENRDDTQAVKTLMDLFTEEIIIANMTPNIWSNSSNTFARQDISVKAEDLNTYLDAAIVEIQKHKDDVSIANKDKVLEQEIFGTDDEALIKFQLYKTCKNLYDKWIGGAQDDNVIFQCGSRNSLDQKIANHYRGTGGGGDVPLRLIDSFRFVTRSFKDIGSDLLINPLPVSEFLMNNPNSSFYDAVTSLLSANNFDFIPLPNYINYNDPETLGTIFEPMPSYQETISNTTCGPTFVCVYIGETSTHLDVANSSYPTDGFDVKCNADGNMMPLPLDFSLTADTHENNIAVFAVNYSQQNQNIFKDITLDQSEFSETAESLQIVDEISKKGAENHKTFGGQNMYNVYSVRSYKAEVEMMGNAMIQPMMLFQLNNIPMFHGAYMIVHVKHSIKPNYMSTHFSGVKIRGPLTPLIDTTDLFMSLLGSLDTSNGNKGATVPLGTEPTNSTTAVNKTGSRSAYFGFVTYDVPESDSLKFQTHDKGIKAKGDSWAMPECGEFIVELAKKWYNQNHTLPGTDTLYINNFGAYGGGTNVQHGGDGGLHAVGLACDMKPMCTKKGMQTVIVNNAIYDRAKNIEFIQMVIDMSNSQQKIKIQNIILNDSVILEHFKNIKNAQGGRTVIQVPGHDNHIHLEFDYPPRVVNELANNVKANNSIVSSGEKGTIVKNTGDYPTETEKIAAMGQI